METVSTHRASPPTNGATFYSRTSHPAEDATSAHLATETHFLNTRFEKGYHPNAWPDKEPALLQREFFASAAHLARLHALTIPDTSAIPFPHNIDACFRSLYEQLQDIDTDLGLVIVQGPGDTICLTSITPLDLQQNAWYVAVRPLYDQCQHPVSGGYRQLLLALLQFLIENMGYTPFWEKDTFMADEYADARRVFDEYIHDEDEETIRHCKAEISFIEQVGNYFREQLRQSRPSLAALLRSYRPSSARGKALRKLATRFARHERRYPLRRFAKEIPNGWLQPGTDERIPRHYFFCLVCDFKGLVYEMVSESIDAEFQDCCVFDIPIGMQYFESKQSRVHHELRYEKACLQLIEEFETFLNVHS